MTFNYMQYCAQMRGKRQEPMSLKDFNKMMGIETEKVMPPLQIRPKKDSRPVDATFSNHAALNH